MSGRQDSEPVEVATISLLAEGRTPVIGRATAYVCRDFACQAPTTEPARILEQIEETP